jgi:hypothetical protein
VDASSGPGGWLAFAAPAIQRAEPLRVMLRPADAVAVSWQFAFQFPCLREPRVVDGITEPPSAAVLWTERPMGGTEDNTWQPFRGGLFGQVQRSRATLGLAAFIAGQPGEHRIEVLLFASPLARDGYVVRPGRYVSSGWGQQFPAPTRTANDLVRCLTRQLKPGEVRDCSPTPPALPTPPARR